MPKKKENAAGVGRKREIDRVAIYNHFMTGIDAGGSVESVGNVGYKMAELKMRRDGPGWEYRLRYLEPKTAKRRFRDVKSNPFGEARLLAPDRSAEEVDDIVRQIHANMKFVGGLAQLSAKIPQPLKLEAGRPKKKRGKAI